MKEEHISKIKLSYIFNYLIFIFTIIAFLIMFTGFKFTFVEEPVLETTKFGVFKFFTVDSNLLMGISAFLFLYQERKLMSGKIKEIPFVYYLFKFMTTVSVSVTMLVVFFYLGRIAKGGLISLLQNSNLFFHFIIPLLSIITFTIFERTNRIKFSYVICGLIPVLIYGIFYVINIITHIENSVISPVYDWYYFAQGGIGKIYITALIILAFTYVVSLLLWIINRKKV